MAFSARIPAFLSLDLPVLKKNYKISSKPVIQRQLSLLFMPAIYGGSVLLSQKIWHNPQPQIMGSSNYHPDGKYDSFVYGQKRYKHNETLGHYYDHILYRSICTIIS
jgi:hypothetical protein